MKELNNRQKLFCQEYLKDLNGTQAAIRAGYSKKTACEMGSENLRKPNIQEYIKKMMVKVFDKNEVTVERVLDEISKLAFGSNDPILLTHKVKCLDMLAKYVNLYEKDNESKKEDHVIIIKSANDLEVD